MRDRPSVKRLKPMTREARPRPGPKTVTGDQQVAVFADHETPFRRRRADAETEETERADEDGRIAEAQREFDEQHVCGIGQYLAEDDRPGAFAPQFRHGDILASRDLHGGRSCNTRDARRIDEADDEDDEHGCACQRRACGNDHYQGEGEEGDADHRLDDTLGNLVEPAADISRDEAERV
jgi:hypothetical protein